MTLGQLATDVTQILTVLTFIMVLRMWWETHPVKNQRSTKGNMKEPRVWPWTKKKEKAS